MLLNDFLLIFENVLLKVFSYRGKKVYHGTKVLFP